MRRGCLPLFLKVKILTAFSLIPYVLLSLLLGFPAPDQTDPEVADDDVVAMIKSAYLFKFSTSCDWPDEVKQGPFRVGVIGDEGVFRELNDKYATKPVGAQLFEVFYHEELQADDFYHLLYLSPDAGEKEWRAVKKYIADKPTLVVGDGENALSLGAAISFVTFENGTKYIINPESAQKRGISLGSTIMLWAVGK